MKTKADHWFVDFIHIVYFEYAMELYCNVLETVTWTNRQRKVKLSCCIRSRLCFDWTRVSPSRRRRRDASNPYPIFTLNPTLVYDTDRWHGLSDAIVVIYSSCIFLEIQLTTMHTDNHCTLLYLHAITHHHTKQLSDEGKQVTNAKRAPFENESRRIRKVSKGNLKENIY